MSEPEEIEFDAALSFGNMAIRKSGSMTVIGFMPTIEMAGPMGVTPTISDSVTKLSKAQLIEVLSQPGKVYFLGQVIAG